jgi:hypothetical protein
LTITTRLTVGSESGPTGVAPHITPPMTDPGGAGMYREKNNGTWLAFSRRSRNRERPCSRTGPPRLQRPIGTVSL